MKIKFTKMCGAGNDFIVIDDKSFQPNEELIKRLCNRNFGIGADGILLISESNIADFSVRYFNSDGTGDALCINGARSAVLYCFLKNLCEKDCRFEFIGKVFNANVMDMNKVKVFFECTPIYEINKVINFHDTNIEVSFFDIGSKHIVIDWESFQMNLKLDEFSSLDFENFDVNSIGRELRYHHAFFPSGVNVNFIKKLNENLFAIRTYERGVESETLACGSGSICSALFLYLAKKIQPPTQLLTRSEKILEVDFHFNDQDTLNVEIIGHAEKIFEGIIDI
ncbi:MAG: diaminopimelate epimerase [Ignavibacteria bacterium]|nr:diaminopimelate epimerase [Ignavibacteria bacterium]